MRETWVFGVGVLILLSLTIFYPSVGWTFRRVVFRNDNADEAYRRVSEENTILRAVHATDSALRAAGGATASSTEVTSGATPSGTPAFVFSRAPLNYKDEVLVSVGRDHGIKEGDVAVVSAIDPGILVGNVVAVYGTTALVRTVFDAHFESAVRVGEKGIDALLKGGASPHITLIPRRAGISVGDVVYAAGANLPYGLPIGTIERISPAADNVFEEATLVTSYDMNHVNALRIIPGISR